MIFKFLNRRDSESDSDTSEAIQDSILLGSPDDIDDALELMEGDSRFSDKLRYGLEALRYFRAYYGKDGELEPQDPLQKKKAVIMESAWGSELLGMLDDEILAKQA
jgi:hypothetical protein